MINLSFPYKRTVFLTDLNELKYLEEKIKSYTRNWENCQILHKEKKYILNYFKSQINLI